MRLLFLQKYIYKHVSLVNNLFYFFFYFWILFENQCRFTIHFFFLTDYQTDEKQIKDFEMQNNNQNGMENLCKYQADWKNRKHSFLSHRCGFIDDAIWNGAHWFMVLGFQPFCSGSKRNRIIENTGNQMQTQKTKNKNRLPNK